MASTTASTSKIYNFFLGQYDPDTSVTSHFVQPIVLLVLRSILALYAFITIVISITYDCIAGQGNLWMDYFTHLSYLSLMVYLAVSSLFSASYILNVRRGTPQNHLLRTQNKWWTLIYQSLQQSLASYCLLVPIVFWALLSGPLIHDYHAYFSETWWENVSVHALDFVFMFVDLMLSRTRLFWPFISFVLGYLLLYVFLAWAYVPWTGNWSYNFLKFSNGPIDAAYYIGIALASILLFAIMYGLVILRDLIGNKLNHTSTSNIAENPETIDEKADV